MADTARLLFLFFNALFVEQLGPRAKRLQRQLTVAFLVPAFLMALATLFGLSGREETAWGIAVVAGFVNVFMLFIFFIWAGAYSYAAVLVTKADVLVRFNIIPDIEPATVQAFIARFGRFLFQTMIVFLFLCMMQPWANPIAWLFLLTITVAFSVKGSNPWIERIVTYATIVAFGLTVFTLLFPAQTKRLRAGYSGMSGIVLDRAALEMEGLGTVLKERESKGPYIAKLLSEDCPKGQKKDDSGKCTVIKTGGEETDAGTEKAAPTPAPEPATKGRAAARRTATHERRALPKLSKERHQAIFGKLDAYR